MSKSLPSFSSLVRLIQRKPVGDMVCLVGDTVGLVEMSACKWVFSLQEAELSIRWRRRKSACAMSISTL